MIFTLRRPLTILIVVMGLMSWYGLEDRVLFQPDTAKNQNQPLEAVESEALRQQIREITIPTPDGEKLNAWYIPAKGSHPTVVFAHGNGGNIGDRWAVIPPFIERGYGFLAFDYRGYGKSTSKPSEQGLYQDLEASSHFLTEHYHIAPSEQIALGG